MRFDTLRAAARAIASNLKGQKQMSIRRLSDDFAATGQISAADMPHIAALGFKSVMCNRPDGESFGQPGHEEIAKAAAEHGLAFSHFPVISGRVGEADLEAFAQTATSLPKPVLAYCRSGARSAQLWTLWQND
jgi:sulfide:quinone oxidoreductase